MLVTLKYCEVEKNKESIVSFALTWKVEDTEKDQAIFQALVHLERPTHFLSLHSICCP